MSRAGGGGQPASGGLQDAVFRLDHVRPAHDPGTQRQLQGEEATTNNVDATTDLVALFLKNVQCKPCGVSITCGIFL